MLIAAEGNPGPPALSDPGGGGYSGFQVTGMIKWGQKSKPKKIPRASNKTPKIPLIKL